MSNVAELIKRLKLQAEIGLLDAAELPGFKVVSFTECADALTSLDHAASAMSSELFRITADNERATSALRAAEAKLTKAVEARSPLDANELWELLFAITKGAVPEGITDEVLGELASRLNQLIDAEASR